LKRGWMWKNKASSSALVHYIMGRIGEVDKELGGLSDFHLKWIIAFTNHYFGVEQSTIQMDVPKHKIFITPWNHDKIPFSRLKWLKLKFKSWRKNDERDLPSYISLEDWTIKFCRVPRKGQHVESPR
jgi:hypothetical protein